MTKSLIKHRAPRIGLTIIFINKKQAAVGSLAAAEPRTENLCFRENSAQVRRGGLLMW